MIVLHPIMLPLTREDVKPHIRTLKPYEKTKSVEVGEGAQSNL